MEKEKGELFILFIYFRIFRIKLLEHKFFSVDSFVWLEAVSPRNYVYYFKSVKPRINAIVVCSRERENCLNAFKRKIKRVYIYITKFY